MAKKALKIEINLLPKGAFENSFFGKFLKWALTYSRYFIVLTQLLVILVFLSRFKLDRDLTDLHEEIEQKEAIIESSSNFEDEFRVLQEKIKTIKTIQKESSSFDKFLILLSENTPLDVSIQQLSLDKTKLTISVTSLSESGLATLVRNLADNLKVSQINLEQMTQKETGSEIQFTLSGKVSLTEGSQESHD